MGGGGTCTLVRPTTWQALGAPLKRLWSTSAGRVKSTQARNEANWTVLTGQGLHTVPLPDMLRLHFPNGAPCPEELLLVQTCDCVDHAGKVHRGLEFVFNLLHVARQAIVAACEAQTLADEVGSSCPLPFVVLNPVTQTHFDEADLRTFQDAFTAGFRALKPADLKSIAGTLSKHLADAGWALYIGGIVASAAGATAPTVEYAEYGEFVDGASNAFFLASGAVGLVSAFSAKDLADFTVYQSTVYASVPSAVWHAYNTPAMYSAGQRLLSTLYSQWKGRAQAAGPAQGTKPGSSGAGSGDQPVSWPRFDVRVALDMDGVERARAAEMAFDAPPAYNSETLNKIQRHCVRLRTSCTMSKPV